MIERESLGPYVAVAVYDTAPLTVSKVTDAVVAEEEVTVMLVGALIVVVTGTAGEEEGEVEFAPFATTVME